MADERSTSVIDKHLGDRVRARRLEIGMSQQRLAEILDVTFQQVQKYEKGVNRIAASRLFDISVALDLPVATFFENLPGKANARSSDRRSTENSSIDAALAVPGAVEMLRTFAAIPSTKVRRRVLELVRAMEVGE